MTWRMFASLVMLILLAGVTNVPVGSAQAPPPRQQTPDRTGDVQLQAQDVTEPAGPGWDDVDLVELWVGDEGPANVSLGLKLAKWTAFPPRAFGRTLLLNFQVQDQRYEISFLASPCSGGAALRMLNEAAGTFRHLTCLNVTVDSSHAAITVSIAKQQLTDARGLPVRVGSSLDNVFGLSRQVVTDYVFSQAVPSRTSAVDRVPDTGFAPPYKFTVTNAGAGNIQLTSPDPFRFSNGESTTMAFEVHVENLGAQAESLLLELKDLEPSWTGRVPPRATLPAKSGLTVPVVLSTEFTHRHGETATFNLTATSTTDAQTASLPLGIVWADVPQPAGHHDTLYFHTKNTAAAGVGGVAPGNWAYWMNPLEQDKDTAATDAPAPAKESFTETATGRTIHRWSFPLNPAILIGLDFDLAREGKFETSIKTGINDPNARVDTSILYCDPDASAGLDPGRYGCAKGAWVPLATASKTMSVANQQAVAIEAPWKFDARADLLPYKKGSNLMVRVDFVTLHPSTTDQAPATPVLNPKSTKLLLPLFEYHEPIDRAFGTIGSLQLEPLSAFEKPVNPGKTTTFNFRLKNQATEAQSVRLLIEGHNVPWAAWAGPDKFAIGAGETKDLALGVVVPDTASQGERAELFAIAENVDVPVSMAMARLRAVVVTTQDVADEPPTIASAGDTPLPALPMLLAAIGVAAVLDGARRRRPPG